MATLIDFVNAVKAQLNGKAALNHTHAQYIDTNDSRLNHDHSVYVKTVNNEPPDVLGNVDISGAGLSYVQVVSGSEVRPSSPMVFWIGGETEPTNMVVGDVWFKEGQAVSPPTEPVAPTITTTSLNAMTVSAPFTQTLVATGDAPITWAATTGTAPAGLSLSTAGALSGTPTTEGTYNFTVTATNSAGSDTQQYTGTVAAAPTGGGTLHSIFDSSVAHPSTHTLYNDGGGSLQMATAFYGTQPFQVEKVRLWVPEVPPASGDLRLWVALGSISNGAINAPNWADVPSLEAAGRLVVIPQASIAQGWNEVTLPTPAQVNPIILTGSAAGVFVWAGYSFAAGNHYFHVAPPTFPDAAIQSPTAPWLYMAEALFGAGNRSANSVPVFTNASYGLDVGVSPL